jgi:hypothetical protein
MKYIKVYCLESRFSKEDILLDFDFIRNKGDRYEVVSDGEIQTSFPILPGYAIRVVKSFYAEELDVTFVYFKYLKEV